MITMPAFLRELTESEAYTNKQYPKYQITNKKAEQYMRTLYPGEITQDATGKFVAPEYDMTLEQFGDAQRKIDADFEEAKADAEDEIMDEYGEYFENLGLDFDIDSCVEPGDKIPVMVLHKNGSIILDHLETHELDIPEFKKLNKIWIWHGESSDTTCDECAAHDGEIFYKKNDIPECPAHPNCKCSIEECDIDEDGNAIKHRKYAGNDTGTGTKNPIPSLTEEPLKTDKELTAENAPTNNQGTNQKTEVLSDKLKETMAKHEGIKSGLYTDSKGYLTIGIGNNVNKLENFLALNLTNSKTAEKLTDSQKKDMHNHILSEISNKTFNAEKYSHIQMPSNEMYQKFDTQLSQSYKELERKFANFNTLPVSVKQALVDMQFNIGDAGFQKTSNTIGGRIYTGWPRLFDAIKNQDWATAAHESNRKDVQSSRNIWTREKFMLGYNQ